MILGLSGYARVGKDTVGSILVEQHGFKRVAFADALRKLALEINPLLGQGTLRLADVVNAHDWEHAKTYFPETRIFLQRLGVAVRDEIHRDYWVNRALDKALESHRPVVITDVRFTNELKAIRKHFGRVVRIERPGFGPANDHVSETELAGVEHDAVILNAGTVDELALQVAQVLDELGFTARDREHAGTG